jgi:hypothetical protein
MSLRTLAGEKAHQGVVRHDFGEGGVGRDGDKLHLLRSGEELPSSRKVSIAIAGVECAAQEDAADDGVVEVALVVFGRREQAPVQHGVAVEGAFALRVLVDLAGILCRSHAWLGTCLC